MNNIRGLSTKYAYVLFTLFCIVFPFGQLLRVERYIFGFYVVIHPIDIIALLSFPFLFLNKKNKLFSYIWNILYIFISSWLFSIIIFKNLEVIQGLLYLLRIIFYFAFANLVFYLSENTKIKRKLLNMIFLSISVFMAFGIIQLIYFYDLRDLYFVGWDNHLYRLTSTLFDPGYSSTVLIIGLIILNKLNLFINKYLKYLLYFAFFISIIFTFSRAAYVTLFLISVINFKKYFKYILLISVILTLIYVISPKPRSSGVELYRQFSIIQRISNYKDTLNMFYSHPLFGIGFNNICIYRTNYLNKDNLESHSCSGSDSSIFQILATTGIVGVIVIIYSVFKLNRSLKKGVYNKTLLLIFFSVLINSLFNNSLFYNFILGILAVFIGLTRRTKTIPDKLQLNP